MQPQGQSYVGPIRPTSSNNTAGLRKKDKPPMHHIGAPQTNTAIIEGFESAMPKGHYAGRAGYGSGVGIDSYVVGSQANPVSNRIDNQRGSLGQVKY